MERQNRTVLRRDFIRGYRCDVRATTGFAGIMEESGRARDLAALDVGAVKLTYPWCGWLYQEPSGLVRPAYGSTRSMVTPWLGTWVE